MTDAARERLREAWENLEDIGVGDEVQFMRGPWKAFEAAISALLASRPSGGAEFEKALAEDECCVRILETGHHNGREPEQIARYEAKWAEARAKVLRLYAEAAQDREVTVKACNALAEAEKELTILRARSAPSGAGGAVEREKP